MTTIRIQPEEQKDLTLPYPFFISKKGDVGRQDFWKGSPLRLIGFNTKSVNKFDPESVDLKQFIKKPEIAIGKYPIFEHTDGKWYTYKDKIGSITLI